MKKTGIVIGRRMIALITMLCLVGALLVGVSVAWFTTANGVAQDDEFSASSIAAYYASGKGTPDDPFTILKPVHLYNLAWLQYLGVYNTPGEDGTITQTYFKLHDDIPADGLDMGDLVIPPIGTEENPFIGHFDGNGKTIKNATVSNYISDDEGADGGIVARPSRVEQFDSSIEVDGTTQDGKAIIGFFGVIGDWDNTLGAAIVDDTQEDLKIRDKVNAVYDFKLDGLTVRTDTRETLIGLFAGYVNGSVENVGIGSSALVIGNNVVPLNITGLEMQQVVSRYSLIGEYDEEDVAWPDKPLPGGWGDSIAMKNTYDRLLGIFQNDTRNLEYITAETYTYDAQGNQTNYEITATGNTSDLLTADKGSAGNYVFSTHENGSERFMYLYGPSEHTKTITTRRQTSRLGDYIFSGTNYLSLNTNNTGVVSQTAVGSASAWTMDEAGHLYTVKNETAYYLNRSNAGVLTVSTTASTVWKRDLTGTTGTLYCTAGDVDYYLFCRDGTWGLYTIGSNVYYRISNGTQYLNNNNGAIAAGTDEATATLWTFSDTATMGGTITNGGYYLTASRSGSFFNYTYSLTLSTTQEDASTWTGGNNRLSYEWTGWFGATRYVTYNNGWTLGSSATTLTYTPVTIETTVDSFALGFSLNNALPDEYVTTTQTVNYTLDTNATWLPLAIETVNGVEQVAAGNTGYIVSGSDYQHRNAPQMSGNIRVSQYARSDISNSVSGTTLNHARIYTRTYKKDFGYVNSLDDAVNTWDLRKYADCFDTFNATIRDDEDGYVYGLHFMDAQIDIAKKISIDGARVLRQDGLSHKYDGYELPRNAITFNIAEDGYVNFFAGTYFSGNTSFFSFYEIQRDETGAKLQSIKEIVKIYGKLDENGNNIETEQYVYQYKDGTYSQTLPNGYSVIFDTSWITAPDMHNNYVYYFEIPVNAGEFALGSVAESDGAYLLYLDLAANGSHKVAADPEHAIMGVNFVDDAWTTETHQTTVYPGVAASLTLDNGVTTHGTVTAAYDRTSMTNINYQLSGADSALFDIVFVGEDVTATAAPVTVPVGVNTLNTLARALPLQRRRW